MLALGSSEHAPIRLYLGSIGGFIDGFIDRFIDVMRCR